MYDIESIVLTYQNQYRMEFQYYAEFLRYIGVYVCENLKTTEDNDVGCEYDKSDFSEFYSIQKKINFRDSDDKIMHLKEFLKEVFKCKDLEGTWLDDLILIYERYALLQASVTLQYFHVKREQLVWKAGQKFEEAADALVALVERKDYWNKKNVRYAKLYCKQKANLARYLYDKSVIYYIDNLALEGLSILQKFPKFSNVWVLLGLIYEISKDFTRESIDAYNRALDIIGKKPYASNVFYWKGRRCETDITLKHVSDEAYINAYKLVKRYRNIYKVARIYLEEDLQKTIKYFNECIEKIEKKGTYLDPLEQDYYFKVYIQTSSVYLKQKKYKHTIICVNNAIALRKNIVDGKKNRNEYTAFAYEMYGDAKPLQYITLLIKRMGLQNAYHNMAIAYGECGLQKEANKYWKLYKRCL